MSSSSSSLGLHYTHRPCPVVRQVRQVRQTNGLDCSQQGNICRWGSAGSVQQLPSGLRIALALCLHQPDPQQSAHLRGMFLGKGKHLFDHGLPGFQFCLRLGREHMPAGFRRNPPLRLWRTSLRSTRQRPGTHPILRLHLPQCLFHLRLLIRRCQPTRRAFTMLPARRYPPPPTNPTLSHAPNRRRRAIRLKDCDYRQPGACLVTVCTHRWQSLFGEVTDGEMQLNPMGQSVEKE